MLVLISCAKTQRLPTRGLGGDPPFFAWQANDFLAQMSLWDLETTMSVLEISPKLAMLNQSRIQSALHGDAPLGRALDVFDGDVYRAMQRAQWSDLAWGHAQKHLRILSGLYGFLKAEDAVVPHRLEMSTRFPWLDLRAYDFWSRHFRAHAELFADGPLVNLASELYARSVKNAGFSTLDIEFWDRRRDGSWGIIGVAAKRARGAMVNAICQHQWRDPEALKSFALYHFMPEHSSPNRWIFCKHEGS